MLVERWMTKPPITTHPTMPVYLALRKMTENDIRRLPVVTDDGKLLGIVTERDARTVLMPNEITDASQEIVPQEEPVLVREVMARAVIVVHPKDSIACAVRAMHDHKVTGLPVVDEGRCVGVITVQDLLEILSAALDRHVNEVNREIAEAKRAPAEGQKDGQKREAVP